MAKRRSEKLEDLIYNVTSLRGEFFRKLLDPRRDVYEECGYPKLGTRMNGRELQDLYDRESMAARVVEVFPKETWQTTPTVYEKERETASTTFELAWNELIKGLRSTAGIQSHYTGEEGNPLWEVFQRWDIVNGIGSYGILVMGFDDGKDLSQPVEPKEGMKLKALWTFSEAQAPIVQFESNMASPRYALPVMYSVTFNDPNDNPSTGASPTTSTVNIHWTRVIHGIDNILTSSIVGAPRIKPVLNEILGLQKVNAGSPEMYWKGAFPGLALSTHPQLGGDVEIDATGLKDEIEQYQNGLQRVLTLMGMSAQTLSPTVVDPTPFATNLRKSIAIKLGIPMRILEGSERGELASTQDDDAWNDRITSRQNTYVTPRLIVPFIDALIYLKVLPIPKEGYKVDWKDIRSASPADKAGVAGTITQTMATYVQSGLDTLIPPSEFLTKVIGFTPDESQGILEAAEAYQDEKAESQILLPGAQVGGAEPEEGDNNGEE